MSGSAAGAARAAVVVGAAGSLAAGALGSPLVVESAGASAELMKSTAGSSVRTNPLTAKFVPSPA